MKIFYVVSSPSLPSGFCGRVDFFGAILPSKIKASIAEARNHKDKRIRSYVSHKDSAQYLNVGINNKSIKKDELKIGDCLIGIRPKARRIKKEIAVKGHAEEFEGFAVKILEIFWSGEREADQSL
tara:strand:+ start:465 stop:839 length:375 start_codon:yes stop_codon:yes gene_type:complete